MLWGSRVVVLGRKHAGLSSCLRPTPDQKQALSKLTKNTTYMLLHKGKMQVQTGLNPWPPTLVAISPQINIEKITFIIQKCRFRLWLESLTSLDKISLVYSVRQEFYFQSNKNNCFQWFVIFQFSFDHSPKNVFMN